MKTCQIISLALIIFLLTFTAVFAADNKDDKNLVTLTGIISVYEIDENDNITSISLLVPVTSEEGESEDEMMEDEAAEEYIIANTDEASKLFELVDMVVTVKGKVQENEDGQKVIYVREYKVIDEEE